MRSCPRRLTARVFQHLRGAVFAPCVTSQAPATNAKRRLLFPASTSRSRKRHGCGKCAEEETEFCGLVDLVEQRFFEAGVREPELEEVCDPAWKVVDECGYAEGVRYLRTTYDVPRRRRDPAQRKICSFFPHKNGRARCWGCGSKHK